MEIRKTALITGASSGIGYSLAHVFAKNNMNLILIARDESRLIHLKNECEQKYGIQATLISCDLCDVQNSIEKIKTYITETNIHVDILVNNAGFGLHGEFSCTNLDKELNMIQLQTSSVISLTKLFLPQMILKKSGSIINVCSVYSYTTVPYQAIYGACKSFLFSFSMSLAHEMKKHDVHVMALCPGSTQTEFRTRSQSVLSNSKKEPSGMSSDEVAKLTFAAMNRKDMIYVPGIGNKLLTSFAPYVPKKVLSSIVSYVNKKRGVN